MKYLSIKNNFKEILKQNKYIYKFVRSVKKGISYIPQKSFEELKDRHKLPFDFYIPDKNTCIEYDGQQHFFPVRFGGNKDKTANDRFELTKYHDNLKTQYCADNNIKLIRIPYTDFDKIESILDKHFS